MTDLEMTKLCAEAMGIKASDWDNEYHGSIPPAKPPYDPLLDDAQAMALVKRFCLDIEFYARLPIWTVIFDDNQCLLKFLVEFE